MKAFGWTVLSLVFLDEVAAAVAAGVWGAYAGGPVLAVLAPAAVVAVWWTFASPKAPLGHPVGRPVVKALVFVLTALGLWVAGHNGWAVAFLVFSVVVNGLALLPSISGLVEGLEESEAARARR